MPDSQAEPDLHELHKLPNSVVYNDESSSLTTSVKRLLSYNDVQKNNQRLQPKFHSLARAVVVVFYVLIVLYVFGAFFTL